MSTTDSFSNFFCCVIQECADLFGLPYTGVIDRPDLQEILIDECNKINPNFLVNGSPIVSYINHGKGNGVTGIFEDGTEVKGDVLVGLSTSGNSVNILKAIETAKQKGMTTIGFTGETGGKMKDECDILLNVPSTDTPRIQESHILLGHIICQLVEEQYFI